MEKFSTKPQETKDDSNRQSWHIAASIIMVVAAMISATLFAKYNIIPWIGVLFVAGTVGGVVNSFLRAQRLPLSPALNKTANVQRMLIIQVYFSPFIAGIFAMVLYGFFMSGFVQGSLFPEFQNGGETFTTFGDFTSKTEPKTNADAMKAILWAFIAGFSEKLVPNFITKVAREAASPDEVPDKTPSDENIKS